MNTPDNKHSDSERKKKWQSFEIMSGKGFQCHNNPSLPQLFLFLFISTQIVLLGLNNLLMMTSLPSMSSEALTEGLQFLIGALAQAEKKPPLAVADEASTNAFVPFDFISHALLNMPVEQLKYWLARLVLRSSTDDSATVRHNTGLLRKFVEMLTKEAE